MKSFAGYHLFCAMAFFPGLWILPLAAKPNGKIAGTVSDTQSCDSLIGVNVEVMGKQIGGATDPDGYYIIFDVPPGVQTMRFSYLGYYTQVVEVEKTSPSIHSDTHQFKFTGTYGYYYFGMGSGSENIRWSGFWGSGGAKRKYTLIYDSPREESVFAQNFNYKLIFSPMDVPTEGWYEIYAFLIANWNATPGTPYVIFYSHGTDTVWEVQNVPGHARLYKLGDFYLTAGEGQKLVLLSNDNIGNHLVFAGTIMVMRTHRILEDLSSLWSKKIVAVNVELGQNYPNSFDP